VPLWPSRQWQPSDNLRQWLYCGWHRSQGRLVEATGWLTSSTTPQLQLWCGLTCGTMLRMAAVESFPSAPSAPDACLLPPRVATCSCSHTNVTRNRKTAVRRHDAVRRRPIAGVAIATRSPRPAATSHTYDEVEVELHTHS